MSEYIVDTFGIVQDLADLHGDMNTPLYRAIMDVMILRQREQIVRCKDCKYLDRKDYTKTHKIPITGSWCNWFADTCEPDGFCAWGERKEGGDAR